MSKKPTNSQAVLADLGARLRTCLKADAGNTFAIAAVLADARNILDHGDWLPWLETYGISETSGRRYLAAHKFKLAIRQPPFQDLWLGAKSAKLADLKLRASAIYQLAGLLEMIPEAGLGFDDGAIVTVTTDDIKAVLVAARETWIGPKRLEAIIRGRHPDEAPAVEQPTPEPEPEVAQDDDDDEAGETDAPRLPRMPKSETQPPKQAVDMVSFASWVEGIWRMRDDTAPHTLRNAPIKREQIEEAIAFLQAVAELLPATVVPFRGSADTELSPQQVTERMEALEQAPA